jgi:hypothetical protein
MGLFNRYRESASERGYTHLWSAWRNGFISRNPLCLRCFARGRTTAATVADHHLPGRTGGSWFGSGSGDWSGFERGEASNGQRIIPLCHDCHNTKRGEELSAEKQCTGIVTLKVLNKVLYAGLSLEGIPIDGVELLRIYDQEYRKSMAP